MEPQTYPDRNAGIFCVAFDPSHFATALSMCQTEAETEVIFQEKQDCIESIIKILEQTSAWRKAITAKFPNDPRNKRAAETLDSLADQAAGMTDEQWESLKSYYSWSSESWRNAVNHTARGVAFHYRSADLKFFVKALVEQLSLSSSVAA